MTNDSIKAIDTLDHVTPSALASHDMTELYSFSEAVTMPYGDPAADIQVPGLSSECPCDANRDTDCLSSCEPSRALFSFLLVPFPSLVEFHLFNKHTP